MMHMFTNMEQHYIENSHAGHGINLEMLSGRSATSLLPQKMKVTPVGYCDLIKGICLIISQPESFWVPYFSA